MQIRKISSANGTLTVPGDKSISHRGVMLGSLAAGVTHIDGFLFGNDCLATIDCFRKMGVKIETDGTSVTVYGNGMRSLKKPDTTLYTANSGTTTRLLCGICAGQDFECEITGDSSICKRPMKRVAEPLSLMGAKIEGDFCPLKIYPSQLHGMDYSMTVASAQVKTALILAALFADSPTHIREIRQSRNHTELMLKAMGADIKTDGLDIFVKPASSLKAQSFIVPADISSAAFFITLGAILPDSRITITNVGINPTRTGIIDVFRAMGADMEISNEKESAGEPAGDITVSSSRLRGSVIEGDLIPRLIDEIPAIAVAAVFAEGTTVIRNAEELKVKESNRIKAIHDQLSKAGADITETEDGLIIRGGAPLHAADFYTYGDHRMAMALSVLAQRIDGVCTIDDEKCVSVSYPSFFEDMLSLGK